MVINIAAALANDKGALVDDITAVADAVHEGGAILKVIIETALLGDAQKMLACEPPRWRPGRLREDLHGLQRRRAPRRRRRADGAAPWPDSSASRPRAACVRSPTTAATIAARCKRIGASSGIAIVKGEQGSSGY